MIDDKDILQALYAACVQAWARFKKRWKGGKSSDKYTASEVSKYFDCSLREVFPYDMKTEIAVGSFSCSVRTSDIFKFAARFERISRTRTNERLTFEL